MRTQAPGQSRRSVERVLFQPVQDWKIWEQMAEKGKVKWTGTLVMIRQSPDWIILEIPQDDWVLFEPREEDQDDGNGQS